MPARNIGPPGITASRARLDLAAAAQRVAKCLVSAIGSPEVGHRRAACADRMTWVSAAFQIKRVAQRDPVRIQTEAGSLPSRRARA
jgi:hypothetical protein